MARKIKQVVSADYTRGLLAAAELADGYNSVSAHPFMLGDCILAKHGAIPKKDMRKNPHADKRHVTESYVKEKTWGPGDTYHTVEVQVNGVEETFKNGQRVRVTIEPHDSPENTGRTEALARPGGSVRKTRSRH